jgi:formylglycine-generating enzyme required for sulfatase activity
VTGTNPSHFSPEGDGRTVVEGMQTGRFPVEQVTWTDASDYCRRLSELAEEKPLGRRYRLPTEAEWEYACREGGRVWTPFYFGDSLSSAQANFDGRSPYGSAAEGPYLARTTRVGSYPPNALGLYDQHGNLLEWCSDWFDPDYYTGKRGRDPKGPRVSPDRTRVVRGGPWTGNAHHCRAAIRNGNHPDQHNAYHGFRVVCEIDLTS